LLTALRVALLITVTACFSLLHAEECEMVTNSSASELIEFLNKDVKAGNPECVSRAIVRLGGFRDPSGTEVLINFLDFRRPPVSERNMVSGICMTTTLRFRRCFRLG
jgi:hypothetical protein